MDGQLQDKQHGRREAAFQRMGAERVRAAVLRGTWSAEKRDAARAWLDLEDAAAWQAKQPEEEVSRGSAVLGLRGMRWWWLVAPGLTAYGLVRLIFRMQHMLHL